MFRQTEMMNIQEEQSVRWTDRLTDTQISLSDEEGLSSGFCHLNHVMTLLLSSTSSTSSPSSPSSSSIPRNLTPPCSPLSPRPIGRSVHWIGTRTIASSQQQPIKSAEPRRESASLRRNRRRSSTAGKSTAVQQENLQQCIR